MDVFFKENNISFSISLKMSANSFAVVLKINLSYFDTRKFKALPEWKSNFAPNHRKQ